MYQWTQQLLTSHQVSIQVAHMKSSVRQHHLMLAVMLVLMSCGCCCWPMFRSVEDLHRHLQLLWLVQMLGEEACIGENHLGY